MSKELFYTLFELEDGKTLRNRVPLCMAGISFPKGTPFPKGNRFAGSDPNDHLGDEVEVDRSGGVLQILRFIETPMPPGIQRDPVNLGWYRGWGVVSDSGSFFAELFGSKAEAEVKRAKMGEDFRVEYCSHRKGTSDFILEREP